MSRRHRSALALLRSQRGVALLFIIAGLAALLMMAALALDVGHTTLNKTYLQNATDAAALAAAKQLDNTGSTAAATAEALLAFGSNATGSGYPELATAYAGGNGTIAVTVQFSSTLPPFTPGSATGPYVRVIATGFTRPTWFARVGGINQTTVAASAVSGPSPTISTACDIVPMMVCAADPTNANGLYGYTLNAPAVLKQAAPGGNTQVGPGNFQLIQLGGSGASVVRQNLAGGFGGCASIGDTITTQPGNEAGPTAQGLDTRFGVYQGGGVNSAQYPPDVRVKGQTPTLTVVDNGTTQTIYEGATQVTSANIDTVLYSYSHYTADLKSGTYDYPPPPGGIGAFGRRIISVPVGDCSSPTAGHGSLPLIGFACYFLLDQPNQQGNNDYVMGQFIGKCDVSGVPGPAPASGPAPYLIQLYHDPASGDS
jgi:Flp pilus assembly protein TadG